MVQSVPTIALRLLVVASAVAFWVTATVLSDPRFQVGKGALLLLFLGAQSATAFVLATRLRRLAVGWALLAVLSLGTLPVLLALVSAVPGPTPEELARQEADRARAEALERKRADRERAERAKREDAERKRQEALQACKERGHYWYDWRMERWTPATNRADDDWDESMRVATSGHLYVRSCRRCNEQQSKTVQQGERP